MQQFRNNANKRHTTSLLKVILGPAKIIENVVDKSEERFRTEWDRRLVLRGNALEDCARYELEDQLFGSFDAGLEEDHDELAGRVEV